MDPLPTSKVSISNETSFSLKLQLLSDSLETLFQHYGVVEPEVSVLLTTDENLQSLNRQFRNIDAPTDVLSFPAGDMQHFPLGDIAISVPYAERQSLRRKVSLETELVLLAIHGGLHLLGFNDETEEEYQDMVRRMTEVACLAGIDLPENWTVLSI